MTSIEFLVVKIEVDELMMCIFELCEVYYECDVLFVSDEEYDFMMWWLEEFECLFFEL